MLIKHLKHGTQAAEPTGLICAIRMITSRWSVGLRQISCSKKISSLSFKGTRIKRIYRMLIKHLKQGTQAKEPTGLIRAIRIIRVLKKSAVCV